MSDTATKDAIIYFRKSNPCITLAEIGNNVGCSKEYARQVLQANNLPTIHWTPKHLCLNCERPLTPRQKKFCSTKCFKQYHSITVECEFCHTLFQRLISQVLHYDSHNKRGHIFCSKQCQGRWLGTNYGGSNRTTKEAK